MYLGVRIFRKLGNNQLTEILKSDTSICCKHKQFYCEIDPKIDLIFLSKFGYAHVQTFLQNGKWFVQKNLTQNCVLTMCTTNMDFKLRVTKTLK